MTSLAPAEPLLLGPIESMFGRLEKNFGGLFRVLLLMRLDGCIEADLLVGALRRLQRRHPKLRAEIIEAGHGRLQFEFNEPARPIPLEITDHEDGDFPWREAAHQLIENAFPTGGPLIAVRVLRSRLRRCSQLLLTASHAITDGLSAIVLVEDLLTEYARGEADPLAPARPVLPAVAEIHARSSGWLDWFWLLGRLRRMMREDGSLRQTALPETRGVQPQSQWVHWVFSREDTLSLVRRCRKQQVSLGAALVAAVFCGLMDCLRISKALFKCTFPFDLRKELKEEETPVNVGCFVSIMNEFYEVQQQPAFWDLARRAHENHQTFVRKGGPVFYYNLAATAVLYDRLRNALRRIKRTVADSGSPDEKRVTLHATHYGVLNLQEAYGSLRPQTCTLTFKNDTGGPSTVVEALVMGQRLNIGFGAACLEPAFWEQLQMAVRRRLDAAISAREEAASQREPPFAGQNEMAGRE